MKPAFDSLNDSVTNLEFLEALSAEDLKKQLQSIQVPTRIVSIYAVGSKHFAWIQTGIKIKKIKKSEV